MSRSNPQLTNPAQRTFEWAGSKGKMQWYDRDAKENVDVALPFEFMVLDQLAKITGYNKATKMSIWSNEVKNLSEDILYVKTKAGPLEAGLYSELSQTPKRGGKYTKSLYIAYKDADEWHIGNFRVVGSSLSSWIDFSKSLQRGALDTGKVIMDVGESQEGQTGIFYPPTYQFSADCSAEEDRAAVKLDQGLQVYLKQYLALPQGDEEVVNGEPTVAGLATPAEQADFDARRAAAHGNKLNDEEAEADQERNEDRRVEADRKNRGDDKVIEDLGGQPVNLDDIPF